MTVKLSDCPCSGKNLDRLIQPAILAILSEGMLHGYGVLERLGQSPLFQKHRPDPTGIYRFLKAMEHRGLVDSEWDTSDSGPARRTFTLTAKGRDCLERWASTLEQYHHQIGQLLSDLRRRTKKNSRPRCRCRRRLTAGT